MDHSPSKKFPLFSHDHNLRNWNSIFNGENSIKKILSVGCVVFNALFPVPTWRAGIMWPADFLQTCVVQFRKHWTRSLRVVALKFPALWTGWVVWGQLRARSCMQGWYVRSDPPWDQHAGMIQHTTSTPCTTQSHARAWLWWPTLTRWIWLPPSHTGAI